MRMHFATCMDVCLHVGKGGAVEVGIAVMERFRGRVPLSLTLAGMGKREIEREGRGTVQMGKEMLHSAKLTVAFKCQSGINCSHSTYKFSGAWQGLQMKVPAAQRTYVDVSTCIIAFGKLSIDRLDDLKYHE